MFKVGFSLPSLGRGSLASAFDLRLVVIGSLVLQKTICYTIWVLRKKKDKRHIPTKKIRVRKLWIWSWYLPFVKNGKLSLKPCDKQTHHEHGWDHASVVLMLTDSHKDASIYFSGAWKLISTMVPGECLFGLTNLPEYFDFLYIPNESIHCGYAS